jgi:hypothetical protein
MTGTWATGWATGDVVTAAEFKKTAGAIFDSTLGASAASIDVTGISNTYAHLMVTVYARGDVASTGVNVIMRFNGDAAANYDYQVVAGFAATAAAAETFAASGVLIGGIPANTAGANLFGQADVFIPHYAASSNNKQFVSMNIYKTGTATTNMTIQLLGGSWRSNAAINQVTLLPTSGNFVAGTRATIHALGA